MKYIYNVTGMTCNGCKASVEDALKKLEGIQSVSVNLENKEAEIEMSSFISEENLQCVLSEKFTISEKKTPLFNQSHTAEANDEKTTLKSLFPLFLILAYILASAIGLNSKVWHFDGFMLDFMGLFFIVFSFFKFLDLNGFAISFKMYDPLANKLPFYAFIYPFIELVLGVLFLFRIEVELLALITIVILGITTVGVTKSLLGKEDIKCACLGSVLNLPMTKATFIENTLMIIMAILLLINS
jgi:copper chaperone CopZ